MERVFGCSRRFILIEILLLIPQCSFGEKEHRHRQLLQDEIQRHHQVLDEQFEDANLHNSVAGIAQQELAQVYLIHMYDGET